MKRLFFVIVCLAIIAMAGFELFIIPSTYYVNGIVHVPSRAVAVFSVLRNKNRWADWWPGEAGKEGRSDSIYSAIRMRDSIFRYHGTDYRFAGLSYDMVEVGIGVRAQELNSQLGIFPIGNQDESLLQWHCTIPIGWNPFRRIGRYLEASRIADDMDTLLGRAAGYLGKKENIYGISIWESSTTDTLLVFQESHFDAAPTNGEVYGLIDDVKKRIAEVHGLETGYPMVNISRNDSAYKVRVAVPTNRDIPDKGRFHFMRLIPGKYLVTEVTGGPGTVRRALGAMQDYIRDYQRTVMAIPFQSLVTNRKAEPDTTHWVTRIYYPIF